MKTNALHQLFFAAAIFVGLATGSPVKAEEFSDDPRLYGTWIMESMQYDGESIRPRNKSGYTQIKHYGKDGTYVCVEFARKTSDKGETYVEVYPHEYGKPGYKLKNRMYIEMGRAPLKDAIVFLDKDTQRGRWGTRTDIWKRITLPKALLDHIITSARIHQERWSGTMQESMKKKLFE
jgi:hypothetical protein